MTQYVVVNNLESGVKKAHRYDPDVNPTYCDYGNHQGFAVLPARPYKPRDKACVEATIGAIQRGFFQSRAERFLAEKSRLHPMAQTRFEISEWCSCKVHPDCHVQVEKNFYSVPYLAVGTTVRVRKTARLVEIFSSNHEALSAHGRLKGTGQFSTDERHYPEEKVSLARFDVCMALREAERIGPQPRPKGVRREAAERRGCGGANAFTVAVSRNGSLERRRRRSTDLGPFRVSIKFIVGPTGSVDGSSIEHDSVGDGAIAECIRAAVDEWVFPAPDEGIVVVTYPFGLQVSE